MLPVGVALGAIVVYVVVRLVDKTARNTVVFSVVFGLFDVITDAAFVYVLFESTQYPPFLKYVALGFVALPVTVNIVAAIYIVARLAGKSHASNAWFVDYYPLAALIAFVSAGHIGAIELLSSRLCGWRGFMAPLDDKDEGLVKKLELATVFLEDLPQLAIQIYVIQGFGLTPITIVTVSASAFAVIFSLLQRSFFFLGHRSRRRLSKSASALTSLNASLASVAVDREGGSGVEMDEYREPVRPQPAPVPRIRVSSYPTVSKA